MCSGVCGCLPPCIVLCAFALVMSFAPSHLVLLSCRCGSLDHIKEICAVPVAQARLNLVNLARIAELAKVCVGACVFVLLWVALRLHVCVAGSIVLVCQHACILRCQ